MTSVREDRTKIAERPASRGYRLEEQVGFLLRMANQRHIAIFTRQIGDLTPPQFAAMAKLHEVGDTSQNQLGALVTMDAATIKGVIDRLRARGFVALARHPEDKRRLVVSLTEQGRETIAGLLPLAREISRETVAPLTRAEADNLIALLKRIT